MSTDLDDAPRAHLKAGALSQAERLDWLQLIRSENVGPITFFELLRHFGSASDALTAIPEFSRRGGRKRALRVVPRASAEEELAQIRASDARLVVRGEADYPPALAHIADAPPVLVVKGHGHMLRRPTVAIVGARNASANGARFARELAAALGQEDLVIASGLARGIDAAAHQGALSSGTIAVVAGGIDVIYPPEHADLFGEIVETGAAISEMPLGAVPQARHFPRRNRLVSGMAYATVVIEAAPRSGSLITARLANEQGREVLAVPGSPLDPRCRGTNNLIRSGATLCEGAADVMRVLEPLLATPLSEPRAAGYTPPPAPVASSDELSRARPMVLEKLSPSPVDIDELIRQSGLSPSVVLTVLLELELAGRARRLQGHQIQSI